MSSLTPELCQTIKKPSEKHVMCSYQWNVQTLVTEVYARIKIKGIPVCMDINGGVYGNINVAVVVGVENAAIICLFMTEDYEKSKSCELELSYARYRNVEVVPCMMQIKASDGSPYQASDWLGALKAGKLWLDFTNAEGDKALRTERVDSLWVKIARKLDVDTQKEVRRLGKADQSRKQSGKQMLTEAAFIFPTFRKNPKCQIAFHC